MVIRRSNRSATAPASGPRISAGSSEVSQTPPTAALCAASPSPASVGGQRGEREQAQPVPQAGQGQRDPQPPEGPDGQHAVPAAAQRGCKVHGVRVSADLLVVRETTGPTSPLLGASSADFDPERGRPRPGPGRGTAGPGPGPARLPLGRRRRGPPLGQQLDRPLQRDRLGRVALAQRRVGLAVGDVRAEPAVPEHDRLAAGRVVAELAQRRGRGRAGRPAAGLGLREQLPWPRPG